MISPSLAPSFRPNIWSGSETAARMDGDVHREFVMAELVPKKDSDDARRAATTAWGAMAS